MTKETDEGDWCLCEEDREILVRLAETVANLAGLARNGLQLIALGEAWDALEAIVEGRTVEVNVGLSVGFRQGDRDASEGLFMCLRINDEELVLDELNTSYSADIGSDHFTRVYARLSPRGKLDSWEADNWLEKLAEVQQLGANLTTERDHV